nr:13496_t:CDS:2 [Entrophospora candida]
MYTLVAADELCLPDLFEILQEYLLKNMEESKVKPFKKIIDKDLFDEILEFHLVEESKQNSTLSQFKRKGVDSILITLQHLVLISNWIDNKHNHTQNNHNSNNNKLYTLKDFPYELKLLLRGTRDGFTPKIFHQKCDLKGPTITVLKIKGTNEILGGYNPLSWKSPDNSEHSKTSDSFIFSLNKKNLNNSTIARPTDSEPIYNNSDYGPCFQYDLCLDGNDFREECQCLCTQGCYDKHIRKNKNYFSVEEYEVFQIIRKKN